jgi:hypothetical protein
MDNEGNDIFEDQIVFFDPAFITSEIAIGAVMRYEYVTEDFSSFMDQTPDFF